MQIECLKQLIEINLEKIWIFNSYFVFFSCILILF